MIKKKDDSFVEDFIINDSSKPKTEVRQSGVLTGILKTYDDNYNKTFFGKTIMLVVCCSFILLFIATPFYIAKLKRNSINNQNTKYQNFDNIKQQDYSLEDESVEENNIQLNQNSNTRISIDPTIAEIIRNSNSNYPDIYNTPIDSISINTNDADFSAFLNMLKRRIKMNWDPPEDVEINSVILILEISKDGNLISYTIDKSSGNTKVDDAAINAVLLTFPIPMRDVPNKFKNANLNVTFIFDDNLK